MNDTRGSIDYADVQGLVRFGYKHMTEGCYYVLRIRDAAAARSWLAGAPIASALEIKPPPPTAVQVAFTAEGLRALGVPARAVEGFSTEFLTGAAGDENRLRRLGDVGSDAPSQWEWGAGARAAHVMVMLFAEPGRLEGLRQSLLGQGWNAAFEEVCCLDTSDLGGFEQFGFMDGVSQPQPDWDLARNVVGDKVTYENVVALGEFLLGYKNEYGKYTERPVLAADAASAALADAQDAPGKKDLGRNGTYLVMRSLRQDVRGFWRYVQSQAGGQSDDQDALAALLVGRKRAGDPLLPIRERSIPGVGTDPEHVRLNQYTYDGDPQGARCPFGAHVRRANPRNADYVDRPSGLIARVGEMLGFARKSFRGDVISSVRFHRLLRRGREYGPKLTPADALLPAPPDDAERGLRFLCLNANISRQFEFVQNAWMMSSKFNGMTGESDPLLGNRLPIAGGLSTDAFTIPRDGGVARCLRSMPHFVAVRGAAYFFLPSLRAFGYFIGKGNA